MKIKKTEAITKIKMFFIDFVEFFFKKMSQKVKARVGKLKLLLWKEEQK